jgi:drug/metabolite transporter (DMT)-like permease
MAVPVAIFWRNLGGALITMPFAIARGEWRRLSKSSWGWSIIAGIFLALHFICFFYSMRLTSVASGTALTATQPIFAALWLRFKGRRVDYRVWLGMAISMVGVLIITGVDSTLSTRSLIGDLVALLGGALAAAYVTAGSHVQKLVSTTTYTTICYLFCALTCLLVIVPSGASLISYPRFEWLLILGLIVGAQLLGHTMFNQVLVRVNPAVVSLIVFFEVPVGALLAAWWLGQVPPAGIIPGIALLIFGSGLVATRTSQLQGDKSDAD